MCSQLELAPGSIVLECGTGSGSLTHSLARSVAPNGTVYTFEFHAGRAARAKEEFERHGLLANGLVMPRERDVQADGFGPDLEALASADAVFLDLPSPWRAVASAAACLRPDGVACSFSPCVEQVQRTVAEMARRGFVDFATREVLLRGYDVRRERLVEDFVGCGLKAKGKVVAAAAAGKAGGAGAKRGKRRRNADDDDGNGDEEDKNDNNDNNDNGDNNAPTTPPPPLPAPSVVVARPSCDARGHTGYLTFARKGVGADI